MLKQSLRFLLLISLFLTVGLIIAQDENTTTVPDLTGLNIPQAAALLNSSGLNLGATQVQEWTADSGAPQDAIGGQSIPTGELVARGTTVDVIVFGSPNTQLLYDDNDITLINNTGGTIDLSRLNFRSVGGNSETSFNANRWQGSLETGDCGQLWSVGRNGAKDVEGCGSIFWLTTNNTAEHFWTGSNGATSFSVQYDGVERVVCTVSVSGFCEFFLPSPATSPVTSYVYFAYTTDQFMIMNPSAGSWMPLPALSVIEANPRGFTFIISGDAVYAPPEVGSIDRLAPQQCWHWTNNLPADTPPLQDCQVITSVHYEVDLLFWFDGFSAVSVVDGQPHACPAPVAGNTTLCIVPR